VQVSLQRRGISEAAATIAEVLRVHHPASSIDRAAEAPDVDSAAHPGE
jgi:hypothetical protein